MIEKRRSRRTAVQLHLSISNIYNQDNSGISNLDSPIEVVNISAYGMGFVSECILPLNYYFDTALTVEEQDLTIHTTLKIIRIDILEKDVYMYGCEFIGLSKDEQDIISKLKL